MNATSRFANIDALLARAKSDLVRVEQRYNSDLHEKQVTPDLKIDIKNLCENLRSVLDYLARETRALCARPLASNEILYFPMTASRTSFEGTMGTSFPGLENHNKPLWDFLESVQPYHGQSSEWLRAFNRLNNENKHNDLVEQTRSETEQIRVHIGNGGMVAWTPGSVRFGPGVFIGGVPVNPQTQMPLPHPSQRVEKVVWVDFRFRGIEVSALALLRSSLSGIERIASEARKLIS